MTKHVSYPKNKIKFLLLEKIHPVAVGKLQESGYLVHEIPRSLSEEEMLEEIRDAHVVGIRSKTRITAAHLQEAKRLLAIGCFGVGTNQVALDAATSLGIPVFNAPISNTRSVAELGMAAILMLARKIGDKNNQMHQGIWDKSSEGANEIRGKTLGILGYGHIGQQVGLMAEAMGMEIVFFDRIKKLPLGTAKQVDTMADVLKTSDFVTLHVPSSSQNKALIGKAELALMKRGSSLLNLSRGDLVDMAALKEAIQSKQLGGAAVDVFAKEPKTNKEEFRCELTGLENVILTPHIGGSTEEAQHNIGVDVANSFIKFIDTGATVGAVNFPQIDMPVIPEAHRILNVHKNIPGVLKEVNRIVAECGANIDSQYLSTYKDIGYLIMDLNKQVSDEVKEKLAGLESDIKTRILY